MPRKQLHTLALAAFAALNIAPMVNAASSDIVISQVYGGGGNTGATHSNDFIELFNRGTTSVNLTGWSVQYASATGTTWTNKTNLGNVSLAPGQYYLVQGASGGANGVSLPTPDLIGTINLSGTAGKVALVNNTTALTGACPIAGVVDFVGFGATATCSESSPTPAPSNTTSVIRAAGGCNDSDNNSSDFIAVTPTPRNTATALNPCSGGATINLSVTTNSAAEVGQTIITVTATASAAVAGNQVLNLAVSGTNVTAADYTLSNSIITILDGQTSGAVTFTVVDDAAAEGSEIATLTLSNPPAGFTLGTATQNITIADNDVATTPIYQIQGTGTTSALLGQTVVTSGVVTRVLNNGFYLQDPTGDGNTATSDGILVFTSTAPTVVAGQLIQLSGTVAEFNTGAATNADTLAHRVTELTAPTGISVTSSGNSITPVSVSLPEAVNDDLERYEGMLVTLTGPLTASQNFFQGRYGQVTLSANGRMENPTNRYRPNTAQAIALADENARRRILLDDGTSLQNVNPTPYIGADNTLRAGDTVAAVTGVIDYGLATSSNTEFGDYKIHPTQAVTFTRANPRTTAPESVGGNIKVASFNVLNYFTTFTNGNTAFGESGQGCSLGGAVAAANCRGANNIAEFNRQRNKIIPALIALNADVVGLMEIQNNGNTAAQNLVDGLNAATGAGTYSVLALPSQGTGTDAIRVAMIYKSAAITLVGASMSDIDPINNRPTLLQKFAAPNGQQFTVVVNHFKSKGSCPTAGSDPANEESSDGQGCWNALRTLQAQRLRTWVAANGTADALIIGDLNAYGQEDPIFDLTSNGFVDQVAAFNNFGYSYVFDGAAGRLDHAISSASLTAKIANVKHWHINADEPSIIDYNEEFKQPACATCGPDYYAATAYRSSDHDPVVIGLNLNDLDGDGLTDSTEVALGTNSQDRDSDDDGIADGVEDSNHNGVVNAGETNPAVADTDGDGIQDGTEKGVTTGVADPDGAGPLAGTNLAIFIADANPATVTLPTDMDTDNDGASDGVEDSNHNGAVDSGEYDPLNPSSFPPATATQQIPAMPAWALMLFAGLLIAIHFIATQRKFVKHKIRG
ncbi:MAG: ExeM/NucH family extracellular endonuclease [Pseudomonadota bacterium]